MKTFLFLPILLALSILCASCKEEVKYTKEELYDMAKKADPSAKLLLPDKMTEGIKCEDYGEGCMSGHRVQILGLELIAVEFSHEDQARRDAKKYNGYYTRNWLLDDVTGEPALEKFVTDYLHAKKP